jgi:hypothetical protein
MVVEDDTQEGGNGFAALGGVQIRAGGKVGHPQVVDERRREAFGGPAQRLAQLRPPGLGVEFMLAQEPVERVERRQLRVLIWVMKAKRSSASACDCGICGSFFMRTGLAHPNVPEKKTLLWDHTPPDAAGRPPRTKLLGARAEINPGRENRGDSP